MAYTIICDSSTDLPIEVVNEFNLKVVSLNFTIENQTYVNDLEHKNYDIKTFYNKLREGELVTTTQVNVFTYEQAIQEEIEKGKDVLILAFSSALSGTYNSAIVAAEKFKDINKKVYVVDTKAASLGEGLIVYLTALQKKAGKTIDEAYQYAKNIVPYLAHWFTVDDLMFLRRGGRVSTATAVIGTVLNIKPILHVDDEGRLMPVTKAFGRKKSLQKLVSMLKETIDTSLSKTVFISHGDDLKAANYVKEKVEELDLDVKIINYVGPVIGAHSGPNTIALFFTATQK